MTEQAYVYLLRCRDGSLYCGWTSDLTRRLAAHQRGRGSRYTASRLPLELALATPMADRGAARREEARIKRLTRTEKLALISASAAGPVQRSPAPRVQGRDNTRRAVVVPDRSKGDRIG